MLRKAIKAKSPSLAVERELWAAGHSVVVGVDEVGRGAWAGPISVGAAVLPADRRVYKVRDSKALTEGEREGNVRPHRGLVPGLGGGPRQPGGVRPARHGARPATG